MAQAVNWTATAFANGTLLILARIKDLMDNDVTVSSLSAIKCTIYSLGKSGNSGRTVVDGHDHVSLTISNVFSDTITTATIDGTEVSYNFHYTLDNSTNECFPNAGERYLVRIDFMPVQGYISPVQILTNTI